MTRFRGAFFLLAAAFLAASVPSFAGPDADYLREKVLAANDPHAAGNFLKDDARQAALKTEDPALFDRVFARAAELKDLQGVLSGAADAHSIRLSLLERKGCAFCLDPVAFPAWAHKNLDFLPKQTFTDLDAALWSWSVLSKTQQSWVAAKKKDAAWPKLSFTDRHALMRSWALFERDALLKLNPADPKSVDGFHARAWAVHLVLGNHEMSDVWNRLESLQQGSASLAEARAKVGKSADPAQKALLAEASSAATPEARLAALSKLFENLGERPRQLLEAAPARADQKFDADSRKVVGSMLKTALLKETEGTFAGRDLKEFYVDRKTPLEIKFMDTSMSALGWYEHGTDALNFNERYVEQYVKSRGLSVEDLKRDPALLGDLARTLVGTFVHEAQHHRQDVWARENKLPRMYHQGDEVEAFQTQAMFLMEKLEHDPKFAAFAQKEGDHSAVLKTGLERARRMKEQGPDYFDWTVPNSHYPEVLSNEGNAWCNILWHNNVSKLVTAELKRRQALGEAERARLDALPRLKDGYETLEKFKTELPAANTASLSSYLSETQQELAAAPELYAKLRARQEAVKKVTMERYKMLESGQSGRPAAAAPPSPGPAREGE